MKLGRTLLFLVVILALALFTFYDFKKAGEEGESKDQAKNVVRFKPEEIQKIELITRLTKTTLQRDGEGWKLEAGELKDQADATTVNNFLLVLSNEKFSAKVDGEASPSTYGLDQPLTRMKLTAANGQVEEIKIGSVKAYDSSLYAQINDEKEVHLIGSTWDAYLAKKASDLRDKHLIRRDLADVKRITITSGKDVTELALGTDWKLTKGDTLKGYPVSAERVKTYLDQLKSLKANEILGSKAKLDRAAYEVRLFSEPAAASVTLRFSSSLTPELPKEAKAAKIPPIDVSVHAESSELPQLVSIPQSLAESARKSAADFYDLKLPFRIGGGEADVRRIEIHAPGIIEGEFVKSGDQETGKWSSTEVGLQRPVDGAKLSELITKLVNTQAEAVGVIDSGTLANRLLLKKATGETVFELSWSGSGKPDPKGAAAKIFARSNLVEPKFSLSAADLKALELDKIVPSDKSTDPPSAAPTPSAHP